MHLSFLDATRLERRHELAFGTELAAWHGKRPPLPDASTYDHPDTIAKLIVTNARECADALSRLNDRTEAKNDTSEADVTVMKKQRTSMEEFTTAERRNLIEVNTADPHAATTVAVALRELTWISRPPG